ncbi:PEP-CTERM sorting domain-containing protein [Rubritalea sp.]|uniref:PEP-CTERM sorting domain-containing protein n=1 Tax=Rubritalea sp. TaxID=2109375 RepID=UPI003EF4DE66
MKISTAVTFILPLIMPSVASAALFVDFTSTGDESTVNAGGLTFSSQDSGATGVSFDITVSAVIPGGGGANGGDIVRINGGLGSTVENTGTFLNNIATVPEVLRFTISNVTGLGAGETLQFASLWSQNTRSTSANQSGGYGGTFGNVAADSVTLTSDNASSVVINQSDTGDLGSIFLNGNDGNDTNTGNTFSHAGSSNLSFTNSFDVRLTDLTANNAVVIQGVELVVVPEPSTSLLVLGGLGTLLIRRRRA